MKFFKFKAPFRDTFLICEELNKPIGISRIRRLFRNSETVKLLSLALKYFLLTWNYFKKFYKYW